MFPSSSSHPFPKVSSKRPPAKVTLASRTVVEKTEAGLWSEHGGQDVVDSIATRRKVTKLILGQNELGDKGCQILFKFLGGTPAGRKHPIEEISLNSNKIGDEGLIAIAAYLTDNVHLRGLFLQNNSFTGDPVTATMLAEAVNSSHLKVVNLTNNHSLSDGFLSQFLSLLDTAELHELSISQIGLTRKGAPSIVSYVTSSRCRLRKLTCNANSLGWRAVNSIARAIERGNYSLSLVEAHSNGSATSVDGLSSGDETSTEEDGSAETAGSRQAITWNICDASLKQVLSRNAFWGRRVQSDSITLLRCSRALLLRPANSADQATAESFVFRDLPPELQLHIMHHIAPSLSSAQLVRIYTYASDISTLPQLLPRLQSSNTMHLVGNKICIGDPSTLPFHGSGSSGCASGSCLGKNSVLCHRDKERERWLEEVGCSVYEP